jgi:hypothetical protein
MNATPVNTRIRFPYGLDSERCTEFKCGKVEIGQEILLRELAASVVWLPTGGWTRRPTDAGFDF